MKEPTWYFPLLPYVRAGPGQGLSDIDSFVVLDIETTGFSPSAHAEIIEIGAVKVSLTRRRCTEKVNWYICPSNSFSIPAKITELTHISWADVEDAPFIEEVLPELARFIGDCPVVAHNAAFDWARFLVPAFRSVGLHAVNPCICTMRLAKEVEPGRGRDGYNLEALCALFGYRMVGHHDALADAMATASLFLHLLDKYQETRRSIDMPSLFSSDVDKSNGFAAKPPMVDFQTLVVWRVSPNKGLSARHGPRIYVSTNFGKLCYSVRRRLWTCVELRTEYDAPVDLWGCQALKKMGLTPVEFVAKSLSSVPVASRS